MPSSSLPFLSKVAWGRLLNVSSSVIPSLTWTSHIAPSLAAQERLLSLSTSVTLQQPPSSAHSTTKNNLHCFTYHYQPSKSAEVTTPPSTAVVQDIIAMKQAFHNSFNTIGNTCGTYTIRTNPAITPVQHTLQKVPIEYQEQIECTLEDMVNKGVITPVSHPIEWVSSLMCPHKP